MVFPSLILGATVAGFFTSLYKNLIYPVSFSAALFFFGWAALTLMIPHEHGQDAAKQALYRALVGLALILLAQVFVDVIKLSAQ